MRTSFERAVIACALAALFVPAACRGRKAQGAGSRRELARVNGEVIFADELSRELRLSAIEDLPSGSDVDSPEQRRRELGSLIDRKLLLQEASKKHVLVPSDQADRLYGRMKADYPSDDFGKLLEQRQLTPEQLKQALRDQLTVAKLLRDEVHARIAITEPELMVFFAAHPELGRVPERARCAQIVQKTLPDIEKVLGQITKGMPFEEAATRYSIAPEANKGGDLGYFDKGVMPEIIETSCFALEIGKVSAVVGSDYGFHLFKLLDKRPAEAVPLESVRDKVEERLRRDREQQAELEFLGLLKSRAQITINDAALAATK